MTSKHLIVLALLVPYLVPACTEAEPEQQAVVLQLPSPANPMPALRDVPQVLMEFHGFADPTNNVFAIWPAEFPETIEQDRYRTAGQGLGWCEVNVDADGNAGSGEAGTVELYSELGTTFSTVAECTTQSEAQEPEVDTDGYATYKTFCTLVTLRSFLVAPAVEMYAELTSHDGDVSQYAYTEDLEQGGNPGDPPWEGRQSPSDERGGLFYYGNMNPNDALTVQWVFRLGVTTPFSFSGQVVAEVQEPCNGTDTDCDGVIDNSCNMFPLFTECFDHDDCASTFCQEDGSEVIGLCHNILSEYEGETASDGATDDLFGNAVATFDHITVVGAPGDESDTGAAYVYHRGEHSHWEEAFKVTLVGGVGGDLFGSAGAASSDRIAVGAPGRAGEGAVYVYTVNEFGTALEATLTFPSTLSFGSAVAMDDEGRLIVGDPDSDVAFVYERTGVSWAHEETLVGSDTASGDAFGQSVSIYWDWAVVGAPAHNTNAGAAYFFNEEGVAWEETKLTYPGTGDLGASVHVDDEDYIVVGAPTTAGGGAAYFFNIEDQEDVTVEEITVTGSVSFGDSVTSHEPFAAVGDLGWNSGEGRVHVIFLSEVSDVWAEHTAVTQDSGSANDNFGTVAWDTSEDSVTLVVGAAGHTSATGAVTMYTVGQTFVHESKYSPADNAAGDLFGYDVAIDGNFFIAGAPGDDSPNNAGAAYVYERNPADGTWSEDAKLRADTPQSDDEFGVAVWIDDTTALVGTPFNDDEDTDAGIVYFFDRIAPSTWVQTESFTGEAGGDEFGNSVCVDGDVAVVGAILESTEGAEAGAAYVYTRSGGTWSLTTKLVPAALDAGDEFGDAVSVAGNYIAVGAPGDDDVETDSGAVYMFLYSGGMWIPDGVVKADTPGDGDLFGSAVSIDFEYMAVGAPEYGPADSGAGYAFARSFSWTQQDILIDDDFSPGDYTGWSVGIFVDQGGPVPMRPIIILGAGAADTRGTDSGALWGFLNNTPTSWERHGLSSPETLSPGDFYGGGEDDFAGPMRGALDIDGDLIVVGASGDDDNGSNAGAVHVNQR